MNVNKPSYSSNPIGSLSALGKALGYDVELLQQLADDASSYYVLAKRIRKKNGEIREVFDAMHPLKAVQRNIVDRLLRRAYYPSYLMGGVKDFERRRGYARNARLHSGSAVLIQEDVTNFFPSIPIGKIVPIFKHVFRFPEDVSVLLARLCTRDGMVVQGASPSTYLANLMFFGSEPQVFMTLAEMNISYTRFIDDLNASSQESMQQSDISAAVRILRSMVEREGLKINRGKEVIATRGQRRQVHKINVDGVRATLPEVKRKAIRAAVFEIEREAQRGAPIAELEVKLRKAKGRLAHLALFHPQQAKQLRVRLLAASPAKRC